jgi:hypothetical protein
MRAFTITVSATDTDETDSDTDEDVTDEENGVVCGHALVSREMRATGKSQKRRLWICPDSTKDSSP